MKSRSLKWTGFFCFVFVLLGFGNELDLGQRLEQIQMLCVMLWDTLCNFNEPNIRPQF